jgi:hypothetical protein
LLLRSDGTSYSRHGFYSQRSLTIKSNLGALWLLWSCTPQICRPRPSPPRFHGGRCNRRLRVRTPPQIIAFCPSVQVGPARYPLLSSHCASARRKWVWSASDFSRSARWGDAVIAYAFGTASVTGWPAVNSHGRRATTPDLHAACELVQVYLQPTGFAGSEALQLRRAWLPLQRPKWPRPQCRCGCSWPEV